MDARALWILKPGQARIGTETLPEPGPGEVRVRARFGALSRGTEALVFQGKVPTSQHQAMRAPFQAGVFPGPVKYGYINVGTVEAGPEALLGRDVFCLFPHQTAYVVPAAAVTPLPEGLPPERAVLAANMETALNVVWDSAARPGDRIAVVGAGVVGCLVARLAGRIPGCTVTLVDTDSGRAAIAAALGVGFAAPQEAPGDQDLVIHASGSPRGAATALGLAGVEATVVEASWYGDTPVLLPLGEAFHSRRLTLRSSQVGMVATAQRPRWDYPRRMAKALDLLLDPALDVLFSGDCDFDELPEVLARLAADPAGALCQRIRYPEK
ncbi:zinc-dependent alcohol dehydrogenase [Inquilinus sp. CA228]|uniref:zinc-dependent alcohol dehydrogenase n=1 Tax=Inquilinus sp. CA228 TaxID=3455609 RepID=UPI003F8D3C05